VNSIPQEGVASEAAPHGSSEPVFTYLVPLDLDYVPYSFVDFLDRELFTDEGPLWGTVFEANLMERFTGVNDDHAAVWRRVAKAAAEYSIDMPYVSRGTGRTVTVRSEIQAPRNPGTVW